MKEETPDAALALWQAFMGGLSGLHDDASRQEKETSEIDTSDILTAEQLSGVVSSLILQGTAEQCQQLAADLIEVQQQLPPEATPLARFLGYLGAALLGETPEVAWLEPPFTEWWQAFQESLRVSPDQSGQQKEGQEDTDEDNPLRVEELPGVVSFALSQVLHGTDEQRQEFAAGLLEAQQQLPVEQAPLGRFWGCLVATLRGETSEVAQLVPPYTEWWQAFQDALSASTNEASQQEKGKHD